VITPTIKAIVLPEMPPPPLSAATTVVDVELVVGAVVVDEATVVVTRGRDVGGVVVRGTVVGGVVVTTGAVVVVWADAAGADTASVARMNSVRATRRSMLVSPFSSSTRDPAPRTAAGAGP